jgi:YggT family protein
LILVEVIFSWLIAFNIVNIRNPIMSQMYNTIKAIVLPIKEPIRRIVPSIGGLDLSPIIALLLIQWVSGFVVPALYKLFGGGGGVGL